MEAEIRYVALIGFREDGIGELKGVFRDIDDAVAVIRKEYDDLCKAHGGIVANKLFNERMNDPVGYRAWGEIRFINDRYWFGTVIESTVR